MIDSSLTLDVARERIGFPVMESSEIFDEVDLFVLWFEKMRKLEAEHGYDYLNNRTLREGVLATQGAWGIKGIDQYGRRVLSEGYCVDFINNPRYTTRFMSVAEATINALEHGTDFGRKGPVRLNFMKGPEGLAIAVTQPGEGFELREPKTSEKRIATKGNGLIYLSKIKIVNVGSDKRNSEFSLVLHYKRSEPSLDLKTPNF